MIFFLLFTSIFILPVIHGNIKDNKCDPPFVPQYLPDHEFGSYCRYSPAYSQIDFVFLIDVSSKISNVVLEKVSTVLYNSLISLDAKFSNNSLTNNVAFVAIANRTLVMAPFGTLNTAEEVKNEFRKMVSYSNQLNSSEVDFSTGLQFLHEKILDYKNNRSKMVIIISDYANSVLSFNQEYANKMKNNDVKIFSIVYATDFIDVSKSYLSKISTQGWIFPLILGESSTSSSLSVTFDNFARQAGCLCPSGTMQFSALIPIHNGTVPYIIEYYADCIYKVLSNEKLSFEEAEISCISDINFDSRLIALNTSAKWNFTKSFLGAEPNFFWSGKNGTQWIDYEGGSSLPVDYLPPSYNDPILQGICQNTFNITAGNGAAIGSRFLCEASFKMAFLPLCETRAYDSANNPKLCSYGFKNKKHA